jgi:hypothetical protein
MIITDFYEFISFSEFPGIELTTRFTTLGARGYRPAIYAVGFGLSHIVFLHPR